MAAFSVCVCVFEKHEKMCAKIYRMKLVTLEKNLYFFHII